MGLITVKDIIKAQSHPDANKDAREACGSPRR